MFSFLTADFVKKLTTQKNLLIKQNSTLQHFFRDIFFPDKGYSLPFLPIRCFRDFVLHAQGGLQENTVFLSSGSTNSVRAKHVFTSKRLEAYAQNSCQTFLDFLQKFGFEKKTIVISLVPPPWVWPQSSLAAMVGMLKTANFNIVYCDVEHDVGALAKLLCDIQTHTKKVEEKKLEEVVIFGTTFHHVLVWQYVKKKGIKKLYKGTKLALVDTGGSKGRTHAMTLEQAQCAFEEAYGNPKEFLFLSEYGMCELASQAWSFQKKHDGSFYCAKTLLPLCVQLKENRVLKAKEKGFLAFIDVLNMESWPTLITEDVGFLVDQEASVFQLCGRAPDASIKGCSLNVKQNFFFSYDAPLKNQIFEVKEEQKKTTSSPGENSQKKWDHQEDLLAFLQTLDPKIWPFSLRGDLCQMLAGWNDFFVKNPKALKEKSILILSSANIPVAWLYPTRVAHLMGAKSVFIKLPSLRSDDEFANRVRLQIEHLVEKLTPYFYPTKIVVEKSRTLSKNFSSFYATVVFGTDVTVKTFQQNLKNSRNKFILQGNVQNGFVVDQTHSAENIADLCSVWFGRGCLTPVCLFMEEQDQTHIQTWLADFHRRLDKNFVTRYAEEGGTCADFLHAHHMAYIESVLKSKGMCVNAYVYRGKGAYVIDLTTLETKDILDMNLDFSFCGCGFLFVFNQNVQKDLPQIELRKIMPLLEDEHGGKTWESHFT